jgi:hypothetical protein
MNLSLDAGTKEPVLNLSRRESVRLLVELTTLLDLESLSPRSPVSSLVEELRRLLPTE